MPVGHDGRDTREKHSGKLGFIDLCTLICEISQKSETGLSPSWYQMICVRYYLRHREYDTKQNHTCPLPFWRLVLFWGRNT